MSSSSAVPITVAVVLSVLFCSIRAYYWFKGRARPPPYISDSSYDIENQAIIGHGNNGQPLDHRPSSPTGPAPLTIVTSTDLHTANHHTVTGLQHSRPKTSVPVNGGASSFLATGRPSSPLHHAVLRSVSYPSQSTCNPMTTKPAPPVSTIQGQAGETTPPSSPTVSSTVSHNCSTEAIHNPNASARDAPTTPAPGFLHTAVSGSWLAMLRHQTYKRVASPTLASPSLPSPSPTPGLAPTTATSVGGMPGTPAPPLVVVQPSTPRPFAFHAPSPTLGPSVASLTSSSATTHASMSLGSAAAPAAAAAAPRRHPRRRTVGSLFRQMYSATPPLVETDEEDQEDAGTGSGTSIVSESGDSFADSLVEKGRLLPDASARAKTRRVAAASNGSNKDGATGEGSNAEPVGSNDGAEQKHPDGRLSSVERDERDPGSVSSDSLDDDPSETNDDQTPIVVGGGQADLDDTATGQSLTFSQPLADGRRKEQPAQGKGRKARVKGAGSASPKSVKSVKSISKSKKKTKRSRRMSV